VNARCKIPHIQKNVQAFVTDSAAILDAKNTKKIFVCTLIYALTSALI